MKSELKDCIVGCRSEGDPASAGEPDAKLDSVFDAGISDLAITRRAGTLGHPRHDRVTER